MASVKEDSWQLRTMVMATLPAKCPVEHFGPVHGSGLSDAVRALLSPCVRTGFHPFPGKHKQSGGRLRIRGHSLLFLRVFVIFLSPVAQT